MFNPQITHRHGIPFRTLAGVPIIEGFRSPCTAVSSNPAVSFGSVTAIPLQSARLPVLHMNLNLSADVFHDFVLPLLQTPVRGFPDEPDPAQPAPQGDRLQFSRVFTGHVPADGSQQIPIDPQISVASFALYDTTRSLQVTVRGASGNAIDLSPDLNGLVVVDDPAALFYLATDSRIRGRGSGTSPCSPRPERRRPAPTMRWQPISRAARPSRLT